MKDEETTKLAEYLAKNLRCENCPLTPSTECRGGCRKRWKKKINEVVSCTIESVETGTKNIRRNEL